MKHANIFIKELNNDITTVGSISPGFAGRCPPTGWHKATQSLTCTHFDPTIFLNFQKKVVVSHRANEPIYLAHGTSFRVLPENVNTGGHGALQGQEDDASGHNRNPMIENWQTEI